MDLSNLSSFRACLRSAAEATGNLVLDLGTLRYINSTGIHALLDAYQMFTLTGRRMALVAVPPSIERVLKAFGVDEILPIFSTVDAALDGLRHCDPVKVNVRMYLADLKDWDEWDPGRLHYRNETEASWLTRISPVIAAWFPRLLRWTPLFRNRPRRAVFTSTSMRGLSARPNAGGRR